MMHTRRHAKSAAVAALLALAAFGCAEERDPIDRVQPNGIHKSMFEGEWYYVTTVVDVPAANGFTFVGDTDHGGMQKVRFDIQEEWLYARRTVENVDGGDRKAEEGEDYEGEVVAAWRIDKHFDIINAYNPTTGERLNIRDENASDRPWYEREYLRVDWSANHIHDLRLSWNRETMESVPYYVQAYDEAGERNPDAPVFSEAQDYFDITNKVFAQAGTFYYPGYGELPVCYLFGEETTECGSGEYTLRHSFKKIDPEHQYEALPFKGPNTNLFGYFTSDRLQYDERTGIREQDKRRFLNRHNLWKRSFDADGNPIPYAEREPKPIVYHVNKEFPEWLKPIAQDVADQWNSAFVDTVRALGNDYAGRMFILCANNPVRSEDPAECGLPGSEPRLGDIRYSFMAYVPKYMKYGLLGLGPSNNDPETGEIISGMAYVYHHNNNAAYRVQELVQLLNGDKASDEYIDGVDLSDWRERVLNDDDLAHTHDLAEAAHMVDRLVNNKAAEYWAGRRFELTEADFEQARREGFDRWVAPHLEDHYRRGFNNGERHAPQARLRNLAGTYIEELLIDDQLKIGMGLDPALPTDDAVLDQISVARGGLGQAWKHRQAIKEKLAASQNKYLPEMADDALMGLARRLKGKSDDEVYETARRAIYTAVLAHEVGHSLGLMHNFGGSDDAINYFDDYWHIRDDGNVGPRQTDPITDAEIDADLYNYGYSSIMDYAGRYTIDGAGIGKYDRAAILFGYAQKVEVFKDDGGVPLADFRDWYERDGDVLQINGNGISSVHYTSYYNRMKEKLYDAGNRMLVDVADLTEDRAQAVVGEETYTRVPYIYCSHSRADLSDSCLTRDFGADSGERMKNILDELNTWYIERAFPRGRVGTNHFNYVSRWYGRIYDRMKNWNNQYGLFVDLLQRFFTPQQLEQFLTDPVNGWGTRTWAVQNAFNYLVQTIMMPNVGAYGGPVQAADGTRKMVQGVFGANLNLGVDQARFFSTSWGDGGRDCGYEWYECLHHVGYYLEKIMAIEALSDSSTNFVARASPEDLRQWEVGYYTTFPEQVSIINAALMNGDFSRVGPYLEFGRLKFPNYAGKLDEVHAAPIDPYATFTIQLYWQVLGQARFHDTFDQTFRDESRVFVLGTGRSPDLDITRVVTFTDPVTGLSYGALRLEDRIGAGHAVLERANRLLQRSSYCDGGNLTVSDLDDCDPQTPASARVRNDLDLLDHVELVKVMADLTPMMDYGNPYDP